MTELVSSCMELLSLKPVQCIAQNENTSASATPVWRAAMPGKNTPKYSAAATAPKGRRQHSCSASRPIPRQNRWERQKRVSRKCRIRRPAASRCQARPRRSRPEAHSSRRAARTRMIGQKLPNCPAWITPGRRRMPTPTVPPKITAIPNPRPRMREREERGRTAPRSAAVGTVHSLWTFGYSSRWVPR